MIPVRFLSPALGEVAEEARTYLAEGEDTAGRFFDELDRVADLIATYPQIGRPAKRNSRKATLRHFPCDVVYKLMDGEALIYALAPHRRAPDYWVDRL